MPAPFFDPETGFSYPGPTASPSDYTPTEADLEGALRSMILSASGWRKVFAIDGDEENLSPQLAEVDRLLALGMAKAYVDFLRQESTALPLRVAVGLDSRPTGPQLGDAMIRLLLSEGVEVDYLGIVAAPEIMAWVQVDQLHAGFVYVSASHNPVGHNGVKFGLAQGGVIGGSQSASLIGRFKSLATNAAQARGWNQASLRVDANAVERVLRAMPASRKRAARAYTALSDTILALSGDPGRQAHRIADLRSLIQDRRLGIVGELNGSARGLSIDQPWLEGLGIRVTLLNQHPRQFVHRIVPEGSSLDLCRSELEQANALDSRFQLGYVPDCDGDRGNVVFFDPIKKMARSLEAQEVFALCVVSELAGLVYYGETGSRVAVACNDPTSLRIEEIAQAFGASVARVEVGEANVVNRARELRDQGYTVRILGEGSNGGNITHPGSVRDPLSTLGSLIKLLCLRSTPSKPGLFELWCQRSGRANLYQSDFTLADILGSLPAWTTTPASEDRAMLKIRSTDHARLKAAFEDLWPKEFQSRRAELQQRWGIVTWEEINYEGTVEKAGLGPAYRSGRQTGGLKILLKDAHQSPRACLWMRGSGTEPVFRILAEVKGDDPSGEAWMLTWLADLVRRADGISP